MRIVLHYKGGPGSGFEGHAGRPGRVGGSSGVAGFKFITINSAKSLVTNLSNRFGMPNVSVEDDLTGEFMAHARGAGIMIDTKLLNDPKNFDTKYNDSIAQNGLDVVTHEYGHIIQRELLLNDKYYTYGLSSPSIQRAHGMDWNTSLGQKLYTIAAKEGGNISEYAKKDDGEYFAEAFILYNRGSGYWDRINPDVLSVFKRLDITT